MNEFQPGMLSFICQAAWFWTGDGTARDLVSLREPVIILSEVFEHSFIDRMIKSRYVKVLSHRGIGSVAAFAISRTCPELP